MFKAESEKQKFTFLEGILIYFSGAASQDIFFFFFESNIPSARVLPSLNFESFAVGAKLYFNT